MNRIILVAKDTYALNEELTITISKGKMGTEKITLDKVLAHLLKISANDDEEIINYAEKYIRKFDRLGNSNQVILYFFSFTILAVSALTPLFNSLVAPNATLGAFNNVDTVKFYTSILAVISAVSAGSLQIIQAFDKMTLEKVSRVNLEREILLYKANGGVYSIENNPKLIEGGDASLPVRRRTLFAQRIAEIIVNKFNRYYSISPGTGQAQVSR